jgi:hypothetical protein
LYADEPWQEFFRWISLVGFGPGATAQVRSHEHR